MVQTRAISAILAAFAMGNVYILYAMVFPLLEKDSLIMSHMDPSDIIGTPFPLNLLCKFVAISLGWNLVFNFMMKQLKLLKPRNDMYESWAVHVALMMVPATVIVYFIFILCGLHPTMLPIHTLVAAFYVALNELIPIILFIPINFTSQQKIHHQGSAAKYVTFKLKEVSKYLFGPKMEARKQPNNTPTTTYQQRYHREMNKIQQIHQCSASGTLVGMGACAILRILDHGMQIQRYPMPIIVGATFGRCGGVLIGTIIANVCSSS